MSYSTCPGQYCAYWPVNQTAICTGCPWGYRANQSQCVFCDSEPKFYDWLYLGFMAILPLLLHCCFIAKEKILSIVLAIVESAFATLLTLLLIAPVGSLRIRSCSVEALSDWYTMLLNPSVNHVDTLHCTQEAVYPLYTMVLIYDLFYLLIMLLLRCAISLSPLQHQPRKSVYAALYFMPALAVIHAIFAGLIYYSFPYLLLALSVIANAVYLARFEEQKTWSLIKTSIMNKKHLAVTVAHWLLLMYAIVALTQMTQPQLQAPLLCLVPVPALFYVVTVKFTNPDKLEIS